MAINVYTNAASGNPTNTYAVPELLKMADAMTVSDPFIKTQRVPKNKNESVTWERAVTPEVDTTETPEGITKESRALTYDTVSKTFEEFDEYFTISSRQADLGERDVLEDSRDRLVDLIKRTREQNGWFEWRDCNNVIYNSSAISSRVTVNGAPTLGRFRVASRLIDNNRGEKIGRMSSGSTTIDSHIIEPAYVVFMHPDQKSDVRDLPGFIHSAKVGGAKERMPGWFGNCEDFMFIATPEFLPRLAAGAAVGSTGMKSVGGVNIDVYTYLCFAKEALGRLALAGSESKGGMGGTEFYVLNKADKSDPTNKRRMVGARWWDGPTPLNQNWCVAIEAGVTANPT